MTTRADVVAAAREWIDCPYEHQARLKGVAVDCAGLVIGVGKELGLFDDSFDVTGYSRRPDGSTLIGHCERLFKRIPHPEMRAGDVVVCKFDSDPQHFGILAPYAYGGFAIIHAASNRGKVIETRLLFGTSPRSMKFVAAYALPGVE